jgi:hypothetical protein
MAAPEGTTQVAVHPERPERDRVNWRKLALKSAFLIWALVCLIVAVLLLGG